LPKRYQDNAVWLMSPQMWALSCLRLVTAVGYEDGRKTFFGYPVVLTSSMPGGTTAIDFSNLVVAAFGDFSQGGMLGLRRDAKVFKSQQKYAAEIY
jgi:HK97 family phage major capsid protein